LPAVLETKGLTKVYTSAGRSPIRAVSDLTLEVQPGEVFGLVGPNGSGKTTTLKLLLGLLSPTAGEALLFGQNPATHPQVRARVGYLPEGPYFYEHLSAAEVLRFYAELFGLSDQQGKARVEELLVRVGMKDREHTLLRECSKGMVQRIGLAQAMINDPDLILLDEPTSGLDPLGARDMRNHILALKAAGKTVFLCSHLLSEVQRICDRVAILHQGRLLEVLRVEELKESLEDRFVALVEGAAE